MYLHVSEDYSRISEEFFINESLIGTYSFQQSLHEFMNVMESVEVGYITVLENEKSSGLKKASEGMKNFIKKIIEFLKNMFERFKDKTATTFQNTVKWASERKDEFSKIEYDGLTMEVVPYWKGKTDSATEVLDTLKRVVTDLSGGKRLPRNVIRERLDKFYIDGDEDQTFIEGLKNIMRVGNVKGVDRITVEGSSLKSLVTGTILPYVIDAHSKVVTQAEKINKDAIKHLEIIENEMNKRNTSVQEGFLPSLGVNLRQTVLTYAPNIVLEADEKKEPGAKDSDLKSRTKVNVVADDDKDTKEMKDDVESKSSDILKAYRETTGAIKTTSAISITIAEERFVFYSNLLKQVWKGGNTRGGRKGRSDKGNSDSKTNTVKK